MDLLKYVREGGRGLLGALAQPLNVPPPPGPQRQPMLEDLAGADGVASADAAYEQDYWNERQRAYEAGGSYWNGSSQAAAAASKTRASNLGVQAQIRELLEKRQDRDSRRLRVDEMIKNGKKYGLSEAEAAQYGVIGPDATAEVLAKRLGSNQAQGVIAVNGGYVYVDPETGEPMFTRTENASSGSTKLIRSIEGNDIVFRHPTLGIEVLRERGRAPGAGVAGGITSANRTAFTNQVRLIDEFTPLATRALADIRTNGITPMRGAAGGRRSSLFTTLSIALKNNYELGALSGPDMGIVLAALSSPDPFTHPAVVARGGEGYLTGQLEELMTQARDKRTNLLHYLTHENPLGPPAPAPGPAPSTPGTASPLGSDVPAVPGVVGRFNLTPVNPQQGR